MKWSCPGHDATCTCTCTCVLIHLHVCTCTTSCVTRNSQRQKIVDATIETLVREEGGMEGERDGGREGEREGGREGGQIHVLRCNERHATLIARAHALFSLPPGCCCASSDSPATTCRTSCSTSSPTSATTSECPTRETSVSDLWTLGANNDPLPLSLSLFYSSRRLPTSPVCAEGEASTISEAGLYTSLAIRTAFSSEVLPLRACWRSRWL